MIKSILSVIQKRVDMFCSFAYTNIDLVCFRVSANHNYIKESIIRSDLYKLFFEAKTINADLSDDCDLKTIIDSILEMISQKISQCDESGETNRMQLSFDGLSPKNSLVNGGNRRDTIPIPPRLCLIGKMNCF